MSTPAITRTSMTDDDGTGTTGTIINNAWKTQLYDQIDSVLNGVTKDNADETISGAWSFTNHIAISTTKELRWGTLVGTFGGRFGRYVTDGFLLGVPGTTSSQGFYITNSDGASIIDFNGDGSIAFFGGIVGSNATGGDKGAGTINAKAVYDDNTLLTDWVFDLFYDGKTEHRVPDGGRLFTLDETTQLSRTERRLPWMPTRDEFSADGSLGNMVTRLWQGQEQQQIFIQELAAKVRSLSEPEQQGLQR